VNELEKQPPAMFEFDYTVRQVSVGFDANQVGTRAASCGGTPDRGIPVNPGRAVPSGLESSEQTDTHHESPLANFRRYSHFQTQKVVFRPLRGAFGIRQM
jgi:hypothetical protein